MIFFFSISLSFLFSFPSGPKVKYLSQGTVLYDYQAQRDDEIPLSANEKVFVLEKTQEGWCKGESSSSKVGWFPLNYIREEPLNLPDHEAPKPPPPAIGLSPAARLALAKTTSTSTTSFKKPEPPSIPPKIPPKIPAKNVSVFVLVFLLLLFVVSFFSCPPHPNRSQNHSSEEQRSLETHGLGWWDPRLPPSPARREGDRRAFLRSSRQKRST